MKRPANDRAITIWLSRLLRWGLGALFIILGIRERYDWYTIVFGIIILLTGFLQPRRCINDRCDVS